jgi:hypothetical protein
MKNLLLLTLFLSLIFRNGYSQTNVSGGIYSDTTWTLANSPYILVDTVVVFPNVTLTIEPGVVVEFADSIELEIRQAKLIAAGTPSDSITFTSTHSSLPGSYAGIYLNGGTVASVFKYCNFRYAATGISATKQTNDPDTVIIDNSIFEYNLYGMQYNGYGNFQVAIIDSSNFQNNTYDGAMLTFVPYCTINFSSFSSNGSNGLNLSSVYSPIINNCNFSNNNTGLVMDSYSITISQSNFSNNITGLQTSNPNPFQAYTRNMRKCVFENNQTGLYSIYFSIDSSIISNNQTGIISGNSVIINSDIDSNSVLGISSTADYLGNSNIRYNATGINAQRTAIDGNLIEFNTNADINTLADGTTSIISGNTIKNSPCGIRNSPDISVEPLEIENNIIEDNDTGIVISNSVSTIRCNTFCNNSSYDFVYRAIGNTVAGFNYWCTSDSAATESVIYDGYDNINYGLVAFMPFDSGCVLYNSVNEIENNNSIILFPNPAENQFSISSAQNNVREIRIINTEGQLMYLDKINRESSVINCPWERGIYFVLLSDGKNWFVKKLAIQ